jgi:glycine oxidase
VNHQPEFRIVGAGLAGTTLAWALHQLGRSVLWIDTEQPATSSRIAAGLMTPITGKRLAKSWRWDDCRPAAERFYRTIETITGASFFQQRPIVRLFTSDLERTRLKAHTDEFANLIEQPEKLVDETVVVAPLGGFLMPTAAQLDVPTYLDCSREWFQKQGRYEKFCWHPNAPAPESPCISIFCQGYTLPMHPAFSAVRFRPAKGEILTVRVPKLNESRVLNRGGFWVALTQTPDVYRIGATYSWHELDCTPTVAGRLELEAQFRDFIKLPYDVIGHDAAVRPIAEGQRPRLGLHPGLPRLGYFNGLSSKGSLLAPYFAEQFASFLCGKGQIEPEVDLKSLF